MEFGKESENIIITEVSTIQSDPELIIKKRDINFNPARVFVVEWLAQKLLEVGEIGRAGLMANEFVKGRARWEKADIETFLSLLGITHLEYDFLPFGSSDGLKKEGVYITAHFLFSPKETNSLSWRLPLNVALSH